MSKGIDLSGLDQFNAAGFLDGIDMEAAASGKPLMIPLTQIQRDEHQPRQEFDKGTLAELAASIKARGVKSPISVKPKNDDGFYVINHGERRVLASRLAGLIEIPAFIDDDHNHYDQMIENIQRENLTPLEIAHFIERRLAAGDKKGDIARTLGKSASYISDHALFFEFPDFIRDLYDSGRCRTIQALAMLHRAYKDFPGLVAGFCTGEREITAAEVRVFVAGLKKPEPAPIITPPAAAPEAQQPATVTPKPTAEPVKTVVEVVQTLTPVQTPEELEAALLEQLERFLAPLESYLKEVDNSEFREAAAERLRKLAEKFSQHH